MKPSSAFVFALLIVGFATCKTPSSMKAGFARVKITPPVGTAMTGFGNRDYDPAGSRAIHDDLYTRALYLTDGKERVLIMGFDLLFFSRDEGDQWETLADYLPPILSLRAARVVG